MNEGGEGRTHAQLEGGCVRARPTSDPPARPSPGPPALLQGCEHAYQPHKSGRQRGGRRPRASKHHDCISLNSRPNSHSLHHAPALTPTSCSLSMGSTSSSARAAGSAAAASAASRAGLGWGKKERRMMSATARQGVFLTPSRRARHTHPLPSSPQLTRRRPRPWRPGGRVQLRRRPLYMWRERERERERERVRECVKS